MGWLFLGKVLGAAAFFQVSHSRSELSQGLPNGINLRLLIAENLTELIRYLFLESEFCFDPHKPFIIHRRIPSAGF